MLRVAGLDMLVTPSPSRLGSLGVAPPVLARPRRPGGGSFLRLPWGWLLPSPCPGRGASAPTVQHISNAAVISHEAFNGCITLLRSSRFEVHVRDHFVVHTVWLTFPVCYSQPLCGSGRGPLCGRLGGLTEGNTEWPGERERGPDRACTRRGKGSPGFRVSSLGVGVQALTLSRLTRYALF